MEENSNKNTEIGEALGELSLGQLPLKNNDPGDVTRKAQEAFREFELKQKALHEQQQKTIEVPKMDESLKFKGIDEIEESLKKFSEKSEKDQKEKQVIENPNIPKDASKIARLTMKISGGLIKEEKQAEYVLLGFAILAFLASGYLFYLGMRGNVPAIKKPSPEILNQMKQK
ncbi:MAG: hypothetical protein WCG45_01725 [bacterium]